jgi:uncharacterized protein YpmB
MKNSEILDFFAKTKSELSSSDSKNELEINTGQVTISTATSERTYSPDHIYYVRVMLGRNAEKLYLTNDSSTGNIYALISSDGLTESEKEILVAPKDVVELKNINWIKIRTDTDGTKYRLSGYKIDKE